MKVDSNGIREILGLQDLKNIQDNKLLVFAFAFQVGNAAAIKLLQEVLEVSDEDLQAFFRFFNEKELTQKKDVELYSKLDKAKTSPAKQTYKDEAITVIEHLNSLIGAKFQATSKKIMLIENWFNKGYSLNDLMLVNTFFAHRWGNNPEMQNYVRVETLFNTKFPERLEDSIQNFKTISAFTDEIRAITSFYAKTYAKYVIGSEISNSDKAYEHAKFETQKTLAFWLNKGISAENICKVIESSVSSWAQNPALLPHISLDKILDGKFEDRLGVVLRKEKIMQQNGMSLGTNFQGRANMRCSVEQNQTSPQNPTNQRDAHLLLLTSDSQDEYSCVFDSVSTTTEATETPDIDRINDILCESATRGYYYADMAG